MINSKEAGRYLIVMATGLGKTAVASHIKRRGRLLFLSHRDELVRQPEKYYDCSFGVEKAGEHASDEEVVSASVQTLCKDNRLKRWKPDTFHTIIIDEAHHAAAPSYRKILGYFSGAKLILGLTATPKRGDKVGLKGIFDEILFERDIRWGIKNGYLCGIKCKEVDAEYSLKKVKTTAGDYNQGDLISAQKNNLTFAVAAKTYIEECHNKKRHTLIYCVSKSICYELSKTIKLKLPEEERDTVQVLTGSTLPEARKEILQEFQEGKIACIINCMVLTEGTDLPIADAIINMRATKNDSLYAQMVGRGTRLYEGKDSCLIIDLCPTEDGAGRNICMAPSLFGLDYSALDKESKGRIDEADDLLEACDEIAGINADLFDMVNIRMRSIGIFTNKVSDIISTYREAGCKEIAERFIELMQADPDTEGMDFCGLVVKRSENDLQKYTVRPNYEDEIAVSAPDPLDMVTVDFHVSVPWKRKREQKHYISRMQSNDAFRMIRDYCESLFGRYKSIWDRATQEKWRLQPATSRQCQRLLMESVQMGFPADSLETLNKLEASQLISVMLDFNKETQLAKLYKIPDSVSEKKKQQAKERALAYSEKRQKELEQGKTDFPEFKKKLDSCVMKYQYRVLDLRKKAREQEADGKFEVEISTSMQEGPPTEKQFSYFQSLMDDVSEKNMLMPGYVRYNAIDFDARDISLMIGMLKFLKSSNFVRMESEFTVDENDIRDNMDEYRTAEKSRIYIFHFSKAGKSGMEAGNSNATAESSNSE